MRPNYFKPNCRECGCVLESKTNRVVLVESTKDTGYTRNKTLGHLCEGCYEKVFSE